MGFGQAHREQLAQGQSENKTMKICAFKWNFFNKAKNVDTRFLPYFRRIKDDYFYAQKS
jgi:hypothetical protein